MNNQKSLLGGSLIFIVILFTGCVNDYQVIKKDNKVIWETDRIFFKNYDRNAHTVLEISTDKPGFFVANFRTNHSVWRAMYFMSFEIKTDKGIIKPSKCRSWFKGNFEYMRCMIPEKDLKIEKIQEATLNVITSRTKITGGINSSTPLSLHASICRKQSEYQYGYLKDDFIEKCYKKAISKYKKVTRIINTTYSKVFNENTKFVKTFNQFQNNID